MGLHSIEGARAVWARTDLHTIESASYLHITEGASENARRYARKDFRRYAR